MAAYDLNDVKSAALQQAIQYRGRKVMCDTANLGYSLADVADCLAKLTTADYRKTHNYENQPPDDEYICKYTKRSSDDDQSDDLYIKFCLLDGCLIIDIASFHLPQFN